MSKRSFLRKSAVSLAATMGLGALGSVASAQITLPPNLQIGTRNILATGALRGEYYDTASNPPTSKFESVSILRQFQADEEAAGTSRLEEDLKVNLDFDQDRGGWGGNPFFGLSTPNGLVDFATNDSLFAVWSGEIVVDKAAAGLYRFDSASDDGTVGFVDGRFIVQNNFYQGRTRRNFTFNLTEGVHTLVMGWYEGGGGANGTFWLYPQGTGAKIVNPSAPPTGITFRKVSYTADSSKNGQNVTVTADSTLEVQQETAVPFGTLTMNDKVTLTVNSLTDVSFTKTTVGPISTFNVNSGNVSTGAIVGGPVTTFTKSGSGRLVADDLGSTAFAAASVLNLTGGDFVARSGGSGATFDSSIFDAKVVINGGTLVGRGVTGEVPGNPNEIGLTFFSGPSATDQIQPIDMGNGLLGKPGGRPVAWKGPLALDDDNPDFGHANFNAVSGGHVGVDNLQVLGLGKMTFTSAPGTGNEYSFATWSDDGVTFWLDLNGNGKFEEEQGELIPLDANSFHAPRVDTTDAPVTIPPGTYRFATGFYEGGGNAVMDFRMARGNPQAADGTYDAYAEIKADFKQITASGNGIVTVSSILFGTSSNFSNPILVQGDGGLTGEDATTFGDVTFDKAATVNTNGAVTVNNVSLNASPGGFRTQTGTLTINNLNIDPGETYNQAAGTATIQNVNISGAGTVNLNSSGRLNIDNVVAGNNTVTVAKAGTGTLAPTKIGGVGLNATSKYDISGGRLLVTNDSSGGTTLGLNNVNLSGGTLELNTVNASPITLGTPFLGEGYASDSSQTNGAPGDAIILAGNGLAALDPPTDKGQAATVNFPSTGGWPFAPAIPDIFQTDDFFARFTGTVPLKAGTTFFTTNSDDGSALFVDLNNDNDFDDAGELVVDNSGLHGMRVRTGSVTVDTPGNFRVRTQMYERGGGAGLIATYGPTLGTGGQIFLGQVSDFGPVDYKANVTSSTANSTINVTGAVGAFLGNVSAESNSLTIQGNRLRVNDVSAGAGGTVLFNSPQGGEVTGAIGGAGTVALGAATLEFTASKATSAGTGTLDIRTPAFLGTGQGTGPATMRFAPGAGNTHAAAGITAIRNEGILHAANGTVDLRSATMTTAAAPAARAGLIEIGLTGSFNTGPVAAPADLNAATFKLELTSANTRDTDGNRVFPTNSTQAYIGEILIGDSDGDGRAGPIAFGEHFDDGVLLKIDGVTYINNNNWNIQHDSGEIELAPGKGPGWYPFEARLGRGGGPNGQQAPWDDFGIGIDTAAPFNPKGSVLDTAAGGQAEANEAAYVKPVDNGSMNLFRFRAPSFGQVQVDSGATLKLGAIQGASAVNLAATSRLELHGPAGSKINASALSFPGTPAAPTATLDVTDAPLALDFPEGGPNPAADVRARIVAARGNTDLLGTWTGPGITSSLATADPGSVSVGFAVNADLPLGPYTTFGGQPVDPTTVLVRGTRNADANLDGVVGDDDVTIVGATFGMTTGATWALGDFTYDGAVNDDDVTLLGALYDPSAPPLGGAPAAAPGVAAVPEPASWLMMALGGLGAGLFGWRRRRK